MILRLFERTLVHGFVNWKTRLVAIHQPALLLSRMPLPIDAKEALKMALPRPPSKKPIYCGQCSEELTGLLMIDKQGEIRCPKCVFVATCEWDQP